MEDLRILGLDSDWNIDDVEFPEPEVVPGFLFTPGGSEPPPGNVPDPDGPDTTASRPGGSSPSDTASAGSVARPADPVTGRPSYTG